MNDPAAHSRLTLARRLSRTRQYGEYGESSVVTAALRVKLAGEILAADLEAACDPSAPQHSWCALLPAVAGLKCRLDAGTLLGRCTAAELDYDVLYQRAIGDAQGICCRARRSCARTLKRSCSMCWRRPQAWCSY